MSRLSLKAGQGAAAGGRGVDSARQTVGQEGAGRLAPGRACPVGRAQSDGRGGVDDPKSVSKAGPGDGP